MVKPEWILIADASRALILQKQSSASFEILHCFSHPQSRLRASELCSDGAGREMGSGHFGGAAYEARTSPKRREHGHFAREIAKFLDAAAHAGRFSSVSIFAASPFLGEIKQALGSATERLLGEVYDVDLKAVEIHQLQARIDSQRAAGSSMSTQILSHMCAGCIAQLPHQRHETGDGGLQWVFGAETLRRRACLHVPCKRWREQFSARHAKADLLQHGRSHAHI